MTQGKLMWRRWGLLASTAGVLVAAIVAPVSGAAARAGLNLGTFAGYEASHRDVRSVQASWVVPRVTRNASAGDQSSTWIGARGTGASSRAPFIQVGVVDNVSLFGRTQPFAFWSDTANDFHPQPLHVALKPGDRLRVILKLGGGRWHVVLDDLTTHREARLNTRQESRDRFVAGQWIQEDPSTLDPEHRLRGVPFAPTSTVRFRALTINGAPPALHSLYSLWMSLPHATLGPTPVVGDSFAVVPRRLSSAAARYLRLVAPEDRTALAFAAALRPWLHGAPSARVDALAARLTHELSAIDTGLDGAGWPAASATPRASLVALSRSMMASLKRVPALNSAARTGWARAWERLTARDSAQGRRLRNRLRAPDITASVETGRSARPSRLTPRTS